MATPTQTVPAYLRHLHIPARKTRFVADTIRGLSVNDAEARLLVSPRRPSEPLLKLLRSAVANATNNFKLEPGKLYVKEVRVDQGPRTKRWMPRARGSVYTIEKKTSHVTIILGLRETARPSRYTFLPKPKKVADAPRGTKKPKAGEKAVPEEETKSHTHVGDKSKPGSGFMKRVFRRKSI